MSVCPWILLDTVGKKKPQMPYQHWDFWSLPDFFELPNGGGGGSRTHVQADVNMRYKMILSDLRIYY